jgi:hypothetical protein
MGTRLWFAAFYLIGGPALAVSLFGAAGFWAIGVRMFNYEGHAKGKKNNAPVSITITATVRSTSFGRLCGRGMA